MVQLSHTCFKFWPHKWLKIWPLMSDVKFFSNYHIGRMRISILFTPFVYVREVYQIVCEMSFLLSDDFCREAEQRPRTRVQTCWWRLNSFKTKRMNMCSDWASMHIQNLLICQQIRECNNNWWSLTMCANTFLYPFVYIFVMYDHYISYFDSFRLAKPTSV
jgi:hypothetical protein